MTGAPFIEVFLGEGEIVVEAVGMWESRSDFQERWETKETVFGFPRFPRPVISTAGRSALVFMPTFLPGTYPRREFAWLVAPVLLHPYHFLR